MRLHHHDALNTAYQGFEQGPIRPPSEAASLLIRVTRNCPWNRCTFCPVYKGAPFSIRPVAHVLRDLDAVYEALQSLQSGRNGADMRPGARRPRRLAGGQELAALRPAPGLSSGCQQPGGGPRGPAHHPPPSQAALPGSHPGDLVCPLQQHRQP